MTWKTFELEARLGSGNTITKDPDKHSVSQTGTPINRFYPTQTLSLPGRAVTVTFVHENRQDDPKVFFTRGRSKKQLRIQAVQGAAGRWQAEWPATDAVGEVVFSERDSVDHTLKFQSELPDMFAATKSVLERGKSLKVIFTNEHLKPGPIEIQSNYKTNTKTLELKLEEGTDRFTLDYSFPTDWNYIRLSKAGSASHVVGVEDGDEVTDYANKYFLLHTGVASLSPFSIEEVSGRWELDTSDSNDTVGYIEALFRHRRAWLTSDEEFRAFKDTHWYKPDDIEMRIGTTFGSDDKSASSVAASGEFYGEFSVGWGIPTAYPNRNGTDGAYSLNLEVVGGFNTNRGANDVHHYGQIGLNLVAGIPFSKFASGKNPRLIEMELGAFWGFADAPQFVGDTNIVRDNRGFPEFSMERTVSLRSDMRIPFGDESFLVFTGRVFSPTDNTDIHPWSLMIGITVPIGTLGKSLLN